jgi:2-polyprenyl-3-methyl-5-hydroxy-6-metoxy-1,4-benzoquinol methylase
MIQTWSRGSADDNMAEDILVSLESVVRRHPWWHARATLLLSLLEQSGVRRGASVLDAGCGWGVTLDALERRGYRTDGLDVSRRSLESLDRPQRNLFEADLVEPLPQQAKQYDAVVALDVIEHIDDDRAAVANLCRLTRPGGVAIVSVPALPELFTEFDRIQGHRRRYVPDTLKQAFAGTGFTVEQVLWWGEWLVPLLHRQRARQRARGNMTPMQIYAEYLKLPRWPLSTALRLGFIVDKRRTLGGRTKRGTSLIAVARRAS